MTGRREFARRWAAAAVLAGAMAAGAAAESGAQTQTEPPGSKRLQRQIEVMERITSQMLVDSPNFLVSGSHAARGLYIDGFGVLISFNASLVEKNRDWDWLWDKFNIRRDGGRIIIDPDDVEDEEDARDMIRNYREWKEKSVGRQGELYSRGKQEIMDLVYDYGESLTRVPDDEWLTFAVFLRDDEFFDSEEISRLVIKAKMRDIRAVAGGDLTQEQLEARMEVQEY
jgi:hypothetical protein